MEKSKDIKETHKDFRSKRGAFSRKSYDGRDGSRNRRVKGKRDGLKRRKLEVGAEFHDRELGTGAVKEINKESMTVQFGVFEKSSPAVNIQNEEENRSLLSKGNMRKMIEIPYSSLIVPMPGKRSGTRERAVHLSRLACTWSMIF